MKYSGYLNKAKTERKENQKFLKNLKRKRNVDDLFHAKHDEAFREIDCLACANCCKTTSPIFKETDIKRIAKNMRMKPTDFINEYLNLDDENDYVLKSSPCTFLNADNTCFIYDYRPQACREYPHTDRKKMTQILDLTYKNTLICPAVAKIVDELKGVEGS